jgi:ATP-dependent RNA helicase DDX31/DBP7
LASQTLDVVEKICRANFAGWIVPGGLLGGDSRQAEKSRLRKGLGIIVATPGRLLDHLVKTQSLAMSLKGGKLHWLVLDECDRLLDMGLGDQIRQIVQIIRANDGGSAKKLSWKSVVVSATITPSVKALATERMLCGDQDWLWIKGVREIKKKDDVTGSALESSSNAHPESDELKSGFGDEDKGAYSESTPRQLTQFHLTVTAKLRLATLVAFLVQRIQKGERTVVFMGTCASVDYHYALFQAMEESIWNSEKEDDHDESAKTKPGLFGTKAQLFKLHGNVPHAKRHQTMKQFNVATCNSYDRKVPPAVLLTTDVAARGLNLEAIDWTVQYDPPCEINDYVHRAGRTARAGKAGHSLLFLLPSEQNYLEVLKAKGVTTLTPLSLSSLLNHAATVCTTVTQDGMYQQGGGEVKMQKRENDTSGHFDVLKSARRGEYFASEVQRRLEDCVVQDDVESRKQWKEAIKQQRKRKQHNSDSSALLRKKEGQLLELARDAFLSFLRAYPTKREQAVRSIFSSRSLHLGHVAKSFALKDPPKSLAAKGKSKRQQLEEESRDEQSNLPRSLAFSQSVGEGIDNIQQRILNEIPIISDVGGDEDYDHARDTSKKRRKSDRDGRQLNAKQMLLENAFKMQSNLMDAM